MRRRKPDLIVPIRDRRQHRRILTLHNLGTALLVLLVAFVAISIRSELRRGPAEGDYGRLYRNELPPPPEAKPLEVVREAAPPVDDQTGADPMLVAPAVRSQRFIESATTGTIAPEYAPAPAAALDIAPRRDGHARIAIVGGAGGVATVVSEPGGETRGKLRGGIFRPAE